MSKQGKQHSLSWLRIEGMYLQTMNYVDFILSEKGIDTSTLEVWFNDYGEMMKKIKPIYEKAKDLWDNEPYSFQKKSSISYNYQQEMQEAINEWVDKWIKDKNL